MLESNTRKQKSRTEEFDNFDWSLDILHSILVYEFPFVKEEKDKCEKRIEYLTIFHVHKSSIYNLESFGLTNDDVLKALMHIKLAEFALAWTPAFTAFSRKVASRHLNCKPDDVPNDVINSKVNIKDTKRYMSGLAQKVLYERTKWQVSQDVMLYFEIELLQFNPTKVKECIVKYTNHDDTNKGILKGFFGAICFLSDMPGVCLKQHDASDESELVIVECIDRLTTLFYGLCVSSPNKHQQEIKRIANILEIFYHLLECENEELFKLHLIKAFQKHIETVDQHVLIRYARRIYMINYNKCRKDFFDIEKEIKEKTKKQLEENK